MKRRKLSGYVLTACLTRLAVCLPRQTMVRCYIWFTFLTNAKHIWRYSWACRWHIILLSLYVGRTSSALSDLRLAHVVTEKVRRVLVLFRFHRILTCCQHNSWSLSQRQETPFAYNSRYHKKVQFVLVSLFNSIFLRLCYNLHFLI